MPTAIATMSSSGFGSAGASAGTRVTAATGTDSGGCSTASRWLRTCASACSTAGMICAMSSGLTSEASAPSARICASVASSEKADRKTKGTCSASRR